MPIFEGVLLPPEVADPLFCFDLFPWDGNSGHVLDQRRHARALALAYMSSLPSALLALAFPLTPYRLSIPLRCMPLPCPPPLPTHIGDAGSAAWCWTPVPSQWPAHPGREVLYTAQLQLHGKSVTFAPSYLLQSTVRSPAHLRTPCFP